jgi:hypothetical protein
MGESAPNPVLRRRIELAIKVLSPMLDLVLLVGDRISRLVEPDDAGYVPPRMPREGESAPRGLPIRNQWRSGRHWHP